MENPEKKEYRKGVKIKNIIKKSAIIVWNLFITFSIVTFLIVLMSVVDENADGFTLVFAICGFCFLVTIVVCQRFNDIFNEFSNKTKKD